MRLPLKAVVAGGLAAATLVGRAMAAEAADGAKPVTNRERIIDAIEACQADATPAWCAPFKPLIDHLNGVAPPATPAPVSMDRTIETVDALSQAFDHALQAGLTLPPDTGPVVAPVRPSSLTSQAAGYASGHGPGGAGEMFAGDGGAKVTVAASTDTKTASIALNVDLSKRFGAPVSLSLTGQTPLGQDSTYQNLATQDGLAKATSIDLKLVRLFQNVTDRAQVLNAPEYKSACQGIVKAIAAAHPSAADDIDPSLLVGSGCSAGRVQQLVDKLVLADAERDALTTALDKLDRATDPVINWMLLASGHAKVGYESHAFYDLAKLDPAAFDPTKTDPDHVDRTPFEVGVAATYVFDRGAMSLGGSFDFQRSYVDGGDKGQTSTLCPTAAARVLTCVTGYVGHPLRTDKYLFTGEFRYIAPDTLPLPFGVNPTFTYDVHSDVYGFQLPIYLVTDANKALTGGIRYDWTSDKHHSVVGVFVTSAFCLLPGYAGCSTASSGGP